MFVEKGKNGGNMFGGSFIVPTRFEFKVLSQYKHIFIKIILLWDIFIAEKIDSVVRLNPG